MKICVVTGCSSGIGKATTELLLEHGNKVYGISRREPAFQSENFVWVECDLLDNSKIGSLSDHIEEEKIDLLFSNAGVAFKNSAVDVTAKEYDHVFNVNVFAPMLLVNALKRKLKKATIVSTSSVSDRIVGGGYSLYCSSKAANTRYFNTLAEELPRCSVYTLLPSYVDTPMLRKLQKGNDEFDWSEPMDPVDVGKFVISLSEGKYDIKSGSNIILVNDELTEDLRSYESLYGFNVGNGKLTKLS